MVQKQSFLGIDTTPRKELWAEIVELSKTVDKQRVKMVEQDGRLQ